MHVHSLDNPNVHTTETTVREPVWAACLGPDTIFGDLEEEMRNFDAEENENESEDGNTGENGGLAGHRRGEVNTGKDVVNEDGGLEANGNVATENVGREDNIGEDTDQGNDTDDEIVNDDVGVDIRVEDEACVVNEVKVVATTQGTSWPNFEKEP